jgi:hypothetical protein
MNSNDQFPQAFQFSSLFLVQDNRPKATAFMVALADRPGQPSRALYLVTARHNIEEADRSQKLTVRHNMKSAPYIERQYEIDDFHLHPTTDIAVAPVRLAKAGLPLSDMHQMFVGDEMMITSEEISKKNISPGSHVCVVSMFPLYTGKDTMEPIWRFGRVAMIPNDLIAVQLGAFTSSIEAILIETMVWPGASGAPVFVNRTGPVNEFRDRISWRLSNHFETPTRNKSPIINIPGEKELDTGLAEAPIWTVHLNTGISTVIPAYLIRKFIVDVNNGLK